MLLIVMPPVPSTKTMLLLVLPKITFMVLPVPVSLFWRVSRLPLALRRMTSLTLLTLVPFKVREPLPEELPMVSARARVLSTLIAPIDNDPLPILMPAVVALPEF